MVPAPDDASCVREVPPLFSPLERVLLPPLAVEYTRNQPMVPADPSSRSRSPNRHTGWLHEGSRKWALRGVPVDQR